MMDIFMNLDRMSQYFFLKRMKVPGNCIHMTVGGSYIGRCASSFRGFVIIKSGLAGCGI
jgi:hypothetical protein